MHQLATQDVGQDTRFGRYQILRKLATGGMAEIYLARAVGIEGFEKLVVLKRILPHLAASEQFVHMFLDEARLAATLLHQNIAQVYDIGCDGGNYFFTMEYVHGEDVRTLLKTACQTGSGVPLEQAVTIVLGAAAGLHAAHEKRGPGGELLGIVHRDVSPSNILVTFDGCVKVVDFGIAKAAGRSSETRTGTLKGKIAYMSPEQCRGEELDRRSDIFSLGIVLYELTTGSRLFRGESDFAIMNQIVSGKIPRPSERRPGYPPGLEAILFKALERDPGRRYATARDLQMDLERFAREEKLYATSLVLQDYMAELFPRRLQTLREAEAEGATPARMAQLLYAEGSSPSTPSSSSLGLGMPAAGVHTGMFAGAGEGSLAEPEIEIVADPVPARPGGLRRRVWAAMGAGAALVVVLLVGWLLGRSGASSEGVPARAADLRDKAAMDTPAGADPLAAPRLEQSRSVAPAEATSREAAADDEADEADDDDAPPARAARSEPSRREVRTPAERTPRAKRGGKRTRERRPLDLDSALPP